ncbi:hypothetical protein EDD22DRAFT_851746 [Suillus occidentalis]|nr:hypothetical protein EDD22DRAFT_851746 [Suillus occidentalis]
MYISKPYNNSPEGPLAAEAQIEVQEDPPSPSEILVYSPPVSTTFNVAMRDPISVRAPTTPRTPFSLSSFESDSANSRQHGLRQQSAFTWACYIALTSPSPSCKQPSIASLPDGRIFFDDFRSSWFQKTKKEVPQPLVYDDDLGDDEEEEIVVAVPPPGTKKMLTLGRSQSNKSFHTSTTEQYQRETKFRQEDHGVLPIVSQITPPNPI